MPVEAAPRDVDTAVFRGAGDLRTVTFAGATVVVRDLKGMRHLARLLAEPGREFHALDLVAVEAGTLPVGGHLGDARRTGRGPRTTPARCWTTPRGRPTGDGWPTSTRTSPRPRRWATRNAPPWPSADRDFLVAELARAYGLGGRARVAGSSAERARVTVTRAIRYALARLAEHHPGLADHLDRTVRTGTYCAYEPDPRAPIVWAI